MIVALLNRKRGVVKTTLALHRAGKWAWQGMRVILIDADPQGSVLYWSQQRSREGLPRLFGVIGHPRDMLHREAPELALDLDHVVIDGSPRLADLTRSAPLATDLVLIPVQPLLLDGWALVKMLSLLQKTRIYGPRIAARFALNRLRHRDRHRAHDRRGHAVGAPHCRDPRCSQFHCSAEDRHRAGPAQADQDRCLSERHHRRRYAAYLLAHEFLATEGESP